MSHVFVVAEAGISHDGNLEKALALIDAARLAQADAVKFQTFSAHRLAAKRQKPDLAAILKPYEMPLSWLPMLKKACDEAKLEFMTTCFDEETLKVVAPFVRRFKISHAESGDEAFVDAHRQYDKPIIASIAGLEPPADPERFGSGPRVEFLYCTSQYPTPLKDLGLCYVRNFDGFSDHTRQILTGALAVANGARIVEVHFRLWETSPENLDWPVSHDPSSLITYIDLVRQAEVAVYGLGVGESRQRGRRGSAPRTSHPQALEESDPSAYHPALEP